MDLIHKICLVVGFVIVIVGLIARPIAALYGDRRRWLERSITLLTYALNNHYTMTKEPLKIRKYGIDHSMTGRQRMALYYALENEFQAVGGANAHIKKPF